MKNIPQLRSSIKNTYTVLEKQLKLLDGLLSDLESESGLHFEAWSKLEDTPPIETVRDHIMDIRLTRIDLSQDLLILDEIESTTGHYADNAHFHKIVVNHLDFCQKLLQFSTGLLPQNSISVVNPESTKDMQPEERKTNYTNVDDIEIVFLDEVETNETELNDQDTSIDLSGMSSSALDTNSVSDPGEHLIEADDSIDILSHEKSPRIRTMILRADMALKKGDISGYREAEKLYKELLNIVPANSENFSFISDALSKLYKKLSNLYSGNETMLQKVLMESGKSLMAIKYYEEAAVYFKRLIDLKNPDTRQEAKKKLHECKKFLEI